MNEYEFLYRHNSLLVTFVLFIAIMVANEVGFRLGRFVQNRTDSEIKLLTGSIQARIVTVQTTDRGTAVTSAASAL